MDAKATHQELKENFRLDLEGQTASLTEAAQQFELNPSNVQAWIKAGLIEVIEPAPRRGMPSKISLRDVAIMAELNRRYRAEGNARGPLKGWSDYNTKQL